MEQIRVYCLDALYGRCSQSRLSGLYVYMVIGTITSILSLLLGPPKYGNQILLARLKVE